MYICEICHSKYKSRMSIMNHIIRSHNYTGKQYYDKFYKKELDGICENCGNSTKFLNIEDGYAKFCSIKCAMPGRAERNLKKYGYKSNFDNPEISKLSHTKEANEKRKNTMLERYGKESYTLTDDFKQKSKEYMTEHKDEISEKRKQTMVANYDVEYNFNRKEVIEKNIKASHIKEANEKRKQTTKKHFGVDSIFKLQEVQEKAQKNSHTVEALKKRTKSREDHINEISYKSEQTKRKKGKNSKLEQLFESLCNIYNIEYIDNYYLDNRYPYLCDFYLPQYDCFVEIFGGWFHNTHVYGFNDEDSNTLKIWKEKAKISKNYKQVVNTWSIKDPMKINKAKENNLNFHILWNIEDINNFFFFFLFKTKKKGITTNGEK